MWHRCALEEDEGHVTYLQTFEDVHQKAFIRILKNYISNCFPKNVDIGSETLVRVGHFHLYYLSAAHNAFFVNKSLNLW